jgi:hypothetical protein
MKSSEVKVMMYKIGNGYLLFIGARWDGEWTVELSCFKCSMLEASIDWEDCQRLACR